MSYEGFTQILCANGHYHTVDAHEDYLADDYWRCPICGALKAWTNEVNTTNGSFDTVYDDDEEGTHEERIDGYVELEEDSFEDEWHVDHHGNKYATKISKYKIPEGRGHRHDQQ